MRHTCPFCKASITEGLALHGGPCPSCFAEIPGEESATDPGEEVKARQAAEDRAVQQRRARLPILIATPVILALVGVLVVALQPHELEEIRFEVEDFHFEIDLVAQPVAEATPAEGAPASKGTASTGTRRRAGTDAAEGDDGVADARDGSRAERAAGGSADASVAEGIVRGAAAAPTAPVSFDAQRTAPVLGSQDDIQAAIGQMFRARAPRLQQCFERALKGNPGLAGSWRLSFTVLEDGTVRDATAVGTTVSDTAFEACLAEEAAGWRLRGRLEKPQPVSFPVRFRGEE